MNGHGLGTWLPLIAVVIAGIQATEDERKLLTDLFKNYTTLERPVTNASHPINLKLGVAIIRIVNVEEQLGFIETNMWIRFTWNDEHLKWNESDYGDTKVLRIPSDRVWKPDIRVYNSEPTHYETIGDTMVLIYPTGDVLWVPPALHRTTCDMDFTNYPFDNHNCSIKFGSWTYDGFKISLALYNGKAYADISDYNNHTEWELLEAPATHHSTTYPCCPEPYESIVIGFHIKRKGEGIYFGAKMMNLFICFLMFMSFLLSPASGQKFLTGLASTLMNLWVIVSTNSVLPFNHNCLMAKYFDKLAIVGFTALILNLLVIHIHFRTQAMPQMMKRIFIEALSSRFCILCPARSRRLVTTEMDTFQNYSYIESPDVSASAGAHADTQHLIAEIKNLKRQITAQNQVEDVADDWKYLALIVNRSFLILYAIVIVLFVSINFPSLE